MNKHALKLLPLILTAAAGCVHYTSIAMAPDNKVFTTKEFGFYIWYSSKMEICDYADGIAKNCAPVREQR
jgi:hypothetical protein